MKNLKIIIILLITVIACPIFSQTVNKDCEKQLNSCDSINNDQALQILNFKTVIKQNKVEIQNLQDNKLDLNVDLYQEKEKVKKFKKRLIISIPSAIIGGIFIGYLIKKRTSPD